MTEDARMFVRYVAPSMAGMVIAGTYSVVDTFFIGKAMGAAGLAAVAVTWPLVMLFGAVGDMLGNGAAIIIARSRGAGLIGHARLVFHNMLLAMTVAGAAATFGVMTFLGPLLRLLGAGEELYATAYQYAAVMTVGSLIAMFQMGWIAVIRNDGHPVLAMWLVIIGLLLNIALDYVFIFPCGWGVRGAAWATVVSQAIVGVVGIGYFFSGRSELTLFSGWRLSWPAMLEIARNGVPTLGNQLSIIVMLFLHNFQSLRYGQVAGLAAYTLIAAIESTGSMLMTGLAAGMQPLAAFLYGAGEHVRKRRIGNYGYWAALALGVAMMVISLAGNRLFPYWFGLDGQVAELAAHGLVISAFAFVLLGVVRVAGYYYQATGKLLNASLLIYGDSFFALPLCLFVLPCWFGLDGVWLAMPVSRVILFAMLCWLWFGWRITGKGVTGVTGCGCKEIS